MEKENCLRAAENIEAGAELRCLVLKEKQFEERTVSAKPQNHKLKKRRANVHFSPPSFSLSCFLKGDFLGSLVTALPAPTPYSLAHYTRAVSCSSMHIDEKLTRDAVFFFLFPAPAE